MQEWVCWGAGVTGVGLLHGGGRSYSVNGWTVAWMYMRKLAGARRARVQGVQVQGCGWTFMGAVVEGCCVQGCRFVLAADTQGCVSAGIRRITGLRSAGVCWYSTSRACNAAWGPKLLEDFHVGGAVLDWCCFHGCKFVGAQRRRVAGIPGCRLMPGQTYIIAVSRVCRWRV